MGGKKGESISERCGITQWRSWSRLPIWMSAHEVDLKSWKHICFSLACIISFLFLFFLFYFFISFCITHSLLWY